MTRKMKRVAFDSNQYEDDRARFKHQTLFQDFMDLQQETEAARSNLLALKQKKLTSQAEVSFLRRRHNFLQQNKSLTLQEQVFMNTQPTQFRKRKKDKVHTRNQKSSHNLPPIGKKNTPRSIPSPECDLILGNSVHGVKQQSVQRAIVNRRVRVNGPKGLQPHDLSRKDVFGSQEHVGQGQSQSQTRKPVIDLNHISEEELQYQHEPFESLTHGLIRNNGGGFGSESGSGSGSGPGPGPGPGPSDRLGKRKISWQDPLAIMV